MPLRIRIDILHYVSFRYFFGHILECALIIFILPPQQFGQRGGFLDVSEDNAANYGSEDFEKGSPVTEGVKAM